MTWKRGMVMSIGVLLVGGAIGGYFIFQHEWQKVNAVTIEEVVTRTIARREESPRVNSTVESNISSTSLAADLPQPTAPLPGEITLLLLGLDTRQGSTSARCDAIHLFTLNTIQKTVRISSIPRGTYVYISVTYPQDQSYFANACAVAGIPYVVKQVEKLLGTHVDYTMKVGFSQTLGVLRTLKLPTTESLQWLRNRKSFLIGDPQRSHNQAMFMKDVLLKRLDTLRSPAWFPMAKVAYSYVDTDLDFASAYALFRLYAESDLEDHPERIVLTMKPEHRTKDMHFDFDQPDTFIKKFSTGVSSSVSPTSTSVTPGARQSLAEVQHQIVGYITTRLNKELPLDEIVHKRLWLQVEDEKTREDLQFRIVRRLVERAKDQEKKIDIVTAYIQEKEAFELTEWVEKGRELMQAITASSS